MGRTFTVMAVTLVLGAGAASAQAPTTPTSSDPPVRETLYATNRHMAFSIRTTVLRWLGGVDIARERDSRAAEREGWWGEPVPHVRPEMVRATSPER